MPCNRCGYCCEVIIVRYPDTPIVREWARARGLKMVQQERGVCEWAIPHACPHLTLKMDTVKQEKLLAGPYLHFKWIPTCNIHDHKPEACQVFPQLTGPDKNGLDPEKSLPKTCGFRKEA